MARKPTDIAILSLRVREDFRRRLAQEAKKHRCSMHAEIIHRLTQSFVSQDLMAHDRAQAEITAEITAEKTANKVIERLRSEVARDQQDAASLLGNLKPTIMEGLSEPAPTKSAITNDEEGKS